MIDEGIKPSVGIYHCLLAAFEGCNEEGLRFLREAIAPVELTSQEGDLLYSSSSLFLFSLTSFLRLSKDFASLVDFYYRHHDTMGIISAFEGRNKEKQIVLDWKTGKAVLSAYTKHINAKGVESVLTLVPSLYSHFDNKYWNLLLKLYALSADGVKVCLPLNLCIFLLLFSFWPASFFSSPLSKQSLTYHSLSLTFQDDGNF
jgi:hypothetical protein